MRIISELDQSERTTLKEKHQGHCLFSTHIESVINRRHCFRVSIFVDDYARILIHSGLPDSLEDYPYQTLSAAIEYVEMNQDFLQTCAQGFLCGQRVKHYLGKLEACQGRLQECFIELGDCFMLDKDGISDKFRNEITDGMHRLVAYGLATDMNESYFPITAYFGTDKLYPQLEWN
jgi:hypothetical protein